mmetsp:Transcript_21488/g.49847  ORF Transcript_21488/g.49847 Transcript_21488/m.49847 type:complete len:245 (+) Transcript_21488:243-977(+)
MGSLRPLAVAPDGVLAPLVSALPAAVPPPLFQVLLVVRLGGVEDSSRLKLSVDGVMLLLHLVKDLLSSNPLLIRVVVDPVPVLRAPVVAHLVLELGVDLCEEELGKSLHRDYFGVIRQLHNLRVPGGSRANSLVAWVFHLALRVTDSRPNHAGHTLIQQLHPPEAAPAKGCDAVAGFTLLLDLSGLGVGRGFSRPTLEVGVVACAGHEVFCAGREAEVEGDKCTAVVSGRGSEDGRARLTPGPL